MNSNQAPSEGQNLTSLSYGVRLKVGSNDPAVFAALPECLPPGWTPAPPGEVDHRGEVIALPCGGASEASRFQVMYDGKPVLETSELDLALFTLEAHLKLSVAEEAHDRVFVHAGVVGHRNRVIVIPGRSFTGKTTLVVALLRAGAVYYSDEYAVFDSEGLVHPYPRRISVRTASGGHERPTPEALGSRVGTEPLPVGMVVVTENEPGAVWQPRQLSAGETALELLNNTVAVRRNPARTLAMLTAAVPGAVGLKGPRGDAEEVARALLEMV
jgi:hypothetical protein